MKTFLAVLFLVACAAGQTSQQMKDQTMTLPYPLTQEWEEPKQITTCPELVESMGGLPECKPSTPKGTTCIDYWPKPEAMDVPAIKTSNKVWHNPRPCTEEEEARPKLANGSCGVSGGEFDVAIWSCAEKSRVLLTAEDGSKHCVKFPKE